MDSENTGQYIEEEKSREPTLDLTYEQECNEKSATMKQQGYEGLLKVRSWLLFAPAMVPAGHVEIGCA